MGDALRLYGKLLSVSLRAQMQYRASFLTATLANFCMTGIEFVALWSLVDRFGGICGWTLAELALLYGLADISFAAAEALAYGFDVFGNLLKSGDFDRVLLRPRSAILQLMGRDLAIKNAGRFLQGAFVLGWACWVLPIAWTPAKAALAVAAILGGICVFFGLFVLQAALSFWTTESLEAMNVLTYGGVSTVQYPLSIYPKWLRDFFVYVVPLGCVNYFPAHAILGRPEPLGWAVWMQWAAPLGCAVFLLAAFQIWKVGVRRYTSTGS